MAIVAEREKKHRFANYDKIWRGIEEDLVDRSGVSVAMRARMVAHVASRSANMFDRGVGQVRKEHKSMSPIQLRTWSSEGKPV